MSSTSSSGLLKNVLPNDMISIMEFRELATAARESAGLMTQAIKEGSEAMKSGMKEAGDEVAGSMAKAGMWVAVGLACVAGAWAFSCEFLPTNVEGVTRFVEGRRTFGVGRFRIGTYFILT